jgi:hypothetical protein
MHYSFYKQSCLFGLQVPHSMDFLIFQVDEVGERMCSMDAVASTTFDQHAAVMAEVQEVLDWARRQFPDAQGPIDEGMDWDYDLHVMVEDGVWHTVTLTLTGTEHFGEQFLAKFGSAQD